MEYDELKKIEDDIAKTEALLDQAQAHCDANKHLWSEEYAWYFQAQIDQKRFHLESNKLIVKFLARTQG